MGEIQIFSCYRFAVNSRPTWKISRITSFFTFQLNILKTRANKILHTFSVNIQVFSLSILSLKHHTMKAFGEMEV